MKIINQHIQKLNEFQAQDVGGKLYQLLQKVGKKNHKSRRVGGGHIMLNTGKQG